jgi:hypothetical protein
LNETEEVEQITPRTSQVARGFSTCEPGHLNLTGAHREREKKMTLTITHQYVQTLRLCLVDMFRLSERCVDYAIKAFQLGRPDIYANARNNPSEMDALQRDVTEYALEILMMKSACDDELRFAVSSLRIADALQAICRRAREIAQENTRMFDDGAEVASEGPGKIGDLAIRFVRLCTVALFEEAIEPAELVLRANRNGGVFAATFRDWCEWNQRVPRIHADWALTVLSNVNHILQQAHEIAGAIVFWLGGQCQDLEPALHNIGEGQHFAFSAGDQRASAFLSPATRFP